jgi:integrase
VRVALQRVPGRGLTLVEPKTGTSQRKIALPGVCVDALRAHRVRQLGERLQAGPAWIDTDLVFTTVEGRAVDGGAVTKNLQRILARCGLLRPRFHDLRHSAASLLGAQGVPARVVMEVLGHSQISVTMDLYSHVFPSALGAAADAMDRVLNSDTTNETEGSGLEVPISSGSGGAPIADTLD